MTKHEMLGATVLFAAAIGLARGPIAAQATGGAAGHWEGAIQVPGQELAISVDLARNADATWEGAIAIPAQNVKALLEQLRNEPNRRAALVSTLVAVRTPDDPEPLIAVGRVAGEIAPRPVGSNGFGFDPVMYIPEFGQTFAQLPVEVKNANSHRGKASRQMLDLIRERWR